MIFEAMELDEIIRREKIQGGRTGATGTFQQLDPVRGKVP